MNIKSVFDWFGVNLHDFRYLHRGVVLSLDVVSFILASFVTYVYLAAVSRFYLSESQLAVFLLLSLACSFCVFLLIRFYRIIIRHANLRDFPKIIIAVAIADLLLYGSCHLISYGEVATPFQLGMACLLSFLITSFIIIGVRIALISFYHVALRLSENGSKYLNQASRVFIYGKLEHSIFISRQIGMNYRDKYQLCGFIDPGMDRKGIRTDNMDVYGKNDLEVLPDRIREQGVRGIVFASRDDLQKEKDKLVTYCTENGVDMFVSDDIRLASDDSLSIEKVQIEDLLNRPEIPIETDRIASAMNDRVIMITGAAGSIGSELVRQLCGFAPRKIVLLDCAETPLHLLRLEIEEYYPHIPICPVIADVRNKQRCCDVVAEHLPSIIFHAAAYKHVPLMEENSCEAVVTNVMGTINMAELAKECQVGKFVMISTDKAVNPTNVMGATKRAAEMYVQSLDAELKNSGDKSTQYITTRFGNVLGSNGSVVPRFREQIIKGGPITVTHPDIIRFFMTIPEACRLVLQAGTMGKGGEIFVFDMGEPVKIADLARRMIALSGFKPDVDIKIEYTGLRPGEKLYEEVLSSVESTTESSHHKIRIAQAIGNSFEEIRELTNRLIVQARERRLENTIVELKTLIPEFKSKNSSYEKYDHQLCIRQ